MHNLGDTVWRATVKRSQVHVACPDCFGRRALRVILGDDSEVVIDAQRVQRATTHLVAM